jgi:hypothetical protein
MKKPDKVLLWTPRILCILAILFISLFALDSFSPDKTFWQNTAAFLMNLLPSFVLLLILIVAWKWPLAGGIILLGAGLVTSILVFNLNYSQRHFPLGQSIRNVSILCLPFLIAGVLFILSHFRNRKEAPAAG